MKFQIRFNIFILIILAAAGISALYGIIRDASASSDYTVYPIEPNYSYYFSGYSEIIYKVNSVVVDVDDQILRVDIDYTRAKVTGNSSYIISSVDCVLKLDSEVTSVLVGDGTSYKTFTPFDTAITMQRHLTSLRSNR